MAASVAPATAQGGWPVFDSSEVMDASSPLSFSIRYPPLFARSRPDLSDNPSVREFYGDLAPMAAGNLVQNFHHVEPGIGRFTVLNIVQGVSTEEEKALLEQMGFALIWEFLGRRIAAWLGASFDGSRSFSFRGHEALEWYRTASEATEAGEAYSSLDVQRIVRKGDHYLILNCFVNVPSVQALSGRWSSSSNPVLDAWCRPFFDSLEFRR